MAIQEILARPITNIAENWEGHTGQEVEDFVCRKLQAANIESASYDSGTSMLTLTRENGTNLEVEVSVITPEYNYGLMLYGVRIDGGVPYTEANPNLLTSYVPGKKFELGVILFATITTSKTLDRIGNFDLKVSFGGKSEIFKSKTVPHSSCIINNGVITGTTTPIEEIAWIDITSLFTSSINKQKISAVVQDDTEIKDTLELTITNDVISLAYAGDIIVGQNNASFTLTGTNNQGGYKLEGFNNSEAITSPGDGIMQYSGLVPGLNQLAIRAVNVTDSNIYTDWCYVDVIYTEGCVNTVVAVNGVSAGINNNGVSTLYELTVFSPKQEEISLTTYLEDNVPNSMNPTPTQVIKSEILGASSYNENNIYSTDYTKYIEINSEGAKKYLLVNIDGQFYQFVLIETLLGGKLQVTNEKYKSMEIENVIAEYTYYQDNKPNLNYDQIVGYSNNVFVTKEYATNSVSANVSEDLESSDGWAEESGRTFFKVSAQNKNVFTQELDLKLSETFTIEMGVKTYNISNENNSILTFGNLELRPTQLCWRYADETSTQGKASFNSRNAQFQEGQETHILLTCTKGYYINKNDIYYPDYLGAVQDTYQTTYDEKAPQTKFNLIRIYINGVIDREFELSDNDLKSLIANKVQIKSTSADVNFYLFRVYNNIALNFDQVQRNYISFLPTKVEKAKFYDQNDILFEDGPRKGEISFAKTLGKYNSIVQIYPKGGKFPHRFWGGVDGDANGDVDKKLSATMFVNYADEATNKQYGGRLTHGRVKGQGSSAMRYLIWNVTFDMGKLKTSEDKKIKSKFMPYNLMDPETNRFVEDAKPTLSNGYIMPPYEGQVDTEPYPVKKMVGKVNFASSMQSHKPGACKLFEDGYKSTVGVLPSGGKKAVHQEPFLYFYWETDLEYDKDNADASPIATVDLADILANNESIEFMGFQTWGAGKGDDAESGFNEDTTPEYLLLEGGENSDPSVNFRVPWQGLQRGADAYYSTKLESKPTISYEESLEHPDRNLWIDDESIVYNDGGAWDIDFGFFEDEINKITYFRFEDGLSGDVEVNGKTYTLGESERNVIESLKKFREFYDFVYKYDYTGVITTDAQPDPKDAQGIIINPWNVKSKYIVTNGTFAIDGVAVSGHQPGDVYRYDDINGTWVRAGVKYENGDWSRLNIFDINREAGTTTSNPETALANMKEIFLSGVPSLGIPKIGDFVNEKDISFHQAFIKLVSGTDNRAKNTYFQIAGPIYEETPVFNEEGNPVLDEKGEQKTKFVKGNKGDYLVRLLGDDLDTVLVTDNNGLQSKPYNLVEASFDESHAVHWGDANNVFFKMYDQTHEEQVKEMLKGILDKAGVNSTTVNNIGTYFYNAFFKIQQEQFPAIAYNHTAKIYYETAYSIKASGIFPDYTNNNVNALSQSHGSCLQCEKQFMKKRLNFLNTYALTQMGESFATASSAGSGTDVTWHIEFEPFQDFYPAYYFGGNGQNKYLGKLNINGKYDIDTYIAREGNQYSVDVVEKNTNVNQGFYRPDLYKSFNMLGLVHTTELPRTVNFGRAIDFKIDNADMAQYKELFASISGKETKFTTFAPQFPVLENIVLNNMELPVDLDFSTYQKLKVINLSSTTGVTSVTFPESGRLEQITLPATITKFKIYNNPGLKTVKFEGIDNLSEVYIDCSKCGQFDVEQFLVKLTSCLGLSSVTIRNANGLNLTESTLQFLLNLKTCILSGTFNVVEDLEADPKVSSAISFATKQQLVNKFGNITDTNNEVVFTFKSANIGSISTPTEIYVYTNANDVLPITRENLIQVSVASGNNVQIVNETNPFNSNVNARLNIEYSIDDTSFATINAKSGAITLRKAGQSKDDKAVITVSLYREGFSTPLTSTTTVYFTWIAPQLGDFAYADGSFSAGYDKNKTLVGLVYARKFSDTEETAGTAYIIGSEYIPDAKGETTTRMTGYTEFNSNISEIDSNCMRMRAITAFLQTLGVSDTAAYTDVTNVIDTSAADKKDIIKFYSNISTGSSNTNISDYDFEDSGIGIYSIQYFTGKADTACYIDHVNQKLLPQIISNPNYTSFISGTADNPYIESLDKLDRLCNTFKNQFTEYDTDMVKAIAFPYFYAFNLYQPTVKFGETLHPSYTQGNWYAPSMSEMMRILYYRDYSASGSIKGFFNLNINPDVENGETPKTTPIFSLAAKRGVSLDVWNNIIDNGYNLTTTVDPTSNENYTFGYYNNQWSWEPGYYQPNSYSADYYKARNAWRFVARKGVPFVQFEFSKS